MAQLKDDNEEVSPEQQPEASDFIKRLATLGGAKPGAPSSLSNSLNTLLGNDDLAAAQQSRNNMQLLSMLGRAGSTAGAALAPMSGVKPSNEFFDVLDKQAQQPIQDVQDKQNLAQQKVKTALVQAGLTNELAKEDSASSFSKITRKIAQDTADKAGMHLKIPDTISASNLEKLMPGITSQANRKIQQEGLSAGREEKASKDKDKELTKLSTKMGEDLDPNRFRSGEMGKNQARINSAERIEALMKQFPDGNIPKIQTRELASSVAALLTSGNQTAVSQINELVPHTLKGSGASIAEWFTGNPTGLQQQSFIKMFVDTAEREKQTAVRQVAQAQIKKAYSTHHKLLEKSPDDFYTILSRGSGLDTDELKAIEAQPGFAKGKYDLPGSAPKQEISSEDKQAIDWAKSNPSDPRAKKILEMHGM